jgi:8-oxo-dGTP diphosphatase
VQPVNLPVYALGGMDSELIPTAKTAGAQGIAGIGGLWPEG